MNLLRVSDEIIDNGIKFLGIGAQITHINRKDAELISLALEELRERRKKDNIFIPNDIVAKMEKTHNTALFVSVKNGEAVGHFCGTEGDLLAMVDFVFEKIEKESDGEITKEDLIGELVSSVEADND